MEGWLIVLMMNVSHLSWWLEFLQIVSEDLKA